MVYAKQMQQQCWMQNKRNMNVACETNTTSLVYVNTTDACERKHHWYMQG